MKFLKLVVLLCTLSQFPLHSFSQTDTTFWFVAPEVCLGNFPPYLDRPIRLVVSTYSTPATVTISQPANGLFTPIVANIPASAMQTFDLSAFLAMIENAPANAILNRGILIQSTATVTAYYEVVSPGNNPEIFTLKGNNALGTDFFIPSQNQFPNSPGYNTDPPKNAFDIVATENNTSVTIIPSQNIIGHSAGIPFTIFLDQGETYSATAQYQTAGGHLSGSRVTSTRPIAITVKDDLIRPFGSSCADLMGDQIVPLTKIGYEHVVVRGFLNDPPNINNEDFVFVLATENNTALSINGSFVTTLNQGATYGTAFTGISAFVVADKPVYVIHVSGTGCEMAQALVPPAPCSGSTEVSFTRTSAQNFGLILLTRSGSEGSFSINTPLSITSGNFSPVPGSGGQWVATMIQCNTTQIPINQNIRVNNSADLFHLGIINYGNAPGGCRYGYFSDYNVLEVIAEDSINLCFGDSALIQANPSMTSYNWNNGATTSSIFVSSPGFYYLSAIRGTCSYYDSIYVNTSPLPTLNLGNDTTFCSGNGINFSLGSAGFQSYQWNNGMTTPFIQASTPGIYSLSVTDSNGCSVADSITLNLIPSDSIYLGNDSAFCNTINTLLTVSGFDSYQWNTGDTTNSILVTGPGMYILFALDTNNCSATDTIQFSLNSLTLNINGDSNVCAGTDITLAGGPGFSSYVWSTGDTIPSIQTSGPGIYTLTVTDSLSCQGSDTMAFNWLPLPFLDIGNDTVICDNILYTLSGPMGFSSYLWNTGSSNTHIQVSQAGTYSLQISDTNGCQASDSISIGTIPAPILNLPHILQCIADSVHLNGGLNYDSYLWSTGAITPSIDVINSGIYILTVSLNNCTATDSSEIILLPPATLSLGGDTIICAGNTLILSGPPGFTDYTWNTGLEDSSLVITSPGTYSISITSCGNVWNDTIEVLYSESLGSIIIPNIFSPNHDLVNEIYEIGGIIDPPAFFELLIYNRWGLLIFESHDYTIGWDGYIHSEDATEGTYHYILNIENTCGEIIHDVGFLTLVR